MFLATDAESRRVLRVGAIGYRHHAATIIDLVNRSGKASVERIYHPSKTIDVLGATNRLDDLLDCDAILILSPDRTHFEYLEFFTKKCDAYIFCEKPPATTRSELEALWARSGDRVFFNFNFRFSF
jgi:predicted dehydrogenase